MASSRKRSRRGRKMEPANLSLQYEIPPNTTSYLDIFSDLSRVNRKLMRQGQNLVISSITMHQDLGTTNDATEITVSAAGNNWITQNAWVKGKALWDQMNAEVLDDQPSIEGKWSDFKIYLLEDMDSSNTLKCTDGAGGTWPATDLEWNYSKYVLPQHATSADPATPGAVIDAQEAVVSLCGEDDKTGLIWRMSLINAYELSRATVNSPAPNVPGTNPDAFFSLLTDYGGQEDELSTVIIDANDVPPYSNTVGNYPGGAVFTTHNALVVQGKAITNEFNPTATVGGFLAPCGLVRIANVCEFTAPATPSNFKLFVNLVPGPSKGVLASPMGQ
jgi:hypothetical protein